MKFSNLECVELEDYVNYFTIHWKLIRWCNYNCSYCIQHNQVKGSNNNIDNYNRLNSYIDKLNIMTSYIDMPISLHLLGGEISYLNLEDILDRFTNPNFKKLSIVTNLSNKIEWYKHLKEYCDKRDIEFSICASLHDEFVTVDDFVSKVKQIKEYTHIQFTVTEDNLDNYHRLLELCNEYDIVYKTEGDKSNNKIPNPEYYQCSSNFPVRAIINRTDTIPIPMFRKQIEFDTEYIYCRTNKSLYIDFQGIASNISCIKRMRYSSLLNLPDDFLINVVHRGYNKCFRGYCGLCGPLSIRPEL